MKKRIAMLLCMVMVLSVALCACSSEKDQLVGTWRGTMNLAEAVNMGMMEADPEVAEYLMVDTLNITFTLTFNKDDTYSMVVDADALDVAMQGMVDEMADGMIEYFEAVLEESGLEMSVEELLAASGLTVDALAEELYKEMDAEAMFTELNSEGNFKVADGKLYMSDGLDYAVDEAVYELYTVEGDTLTINKGEGSEDVADDYVYPMVFKKVS